MFQSLLLNVLIFCLFLRSLVNSCGFDSLKNTFFLMTNVICKSLNYHTVLDEG